jgi:type I restriction enzyme S subunit
LPREMKRKEAKSPSFCSSRGDEALNSNGWQHVRLGDHLAKVGSGFTPLGGHATYQSSGIPLIRSQNVHLNRFDKEGLAFISPQQDAEMKTSRVQPGDVLLNITGASIGRVCVVPAEICPANVNQHVCIIRTDGTLDPEFLSFYLSSPNVQKFIMDSQAGATRQALTKAMIEAFRVPQTDSKEQRRMAGRLREQLAAVAQARAAVQAQLDAAQALPAAHLRAVFNSPAASQWQMKRVEHFIARPLRTGLSKPPCADSKARCLTLSAVRNGFLDYSASKAVAVTEKEARANAVQPETLYVVRGNGNISLVARGALAPAPQPHPVLFSDLLIEVHPNPAVVLPHYLRWVWESPEVRRSLETRSMTSAGIYKINLTNLATVEIPVPSIREQKRIIEKCQAAAQEQATLRERISARLAALNHLPAALLREAFAGKGG